MLTDMGVGPLLVMINIIICQDGNKTTIVYSISVVYLNIGYWNTGNNFSNLFISCNLFSTVQ